MLPSEAYNVFANLPLLTKIACAIYCIKPYIQDTVWAAWAGNWLSGKDRSKKAVVAAARVAHKFRGIPSTNNTFLAAENCQLAVEAAATHRIGDATYFVHSAVYQIALVSPDIIRQVLLAQHMLCPHCYKTPEQHTASGKCLFGAHTWENIDKAWKP